ncbi:hypothetical protein [Polyangium aurulentum]|uniref:hypothetical protein n=1 Tax=Polyangium aurulentum TaxID=2567896 RepID=UPI0010AEA0D8|nr:hypothetical protein [Polyangium aurulentum]UQA60509.1 hypothetical protein E8A73_008570 [Polyangium aurulentum]
MKAFQNHSVSRATLAGDARREGPLVILAALLLGCASSPSSGTGGGGSGASGAGGAMHASSSSAGDIFFDAGASDAEPPDGSKPPVPNLVPNGDFSAGNVQFSSDYAYADLNTVEGEYTVGNDPKAFNANLLMIGDHTTGDGLMFIGNGKPTPDRVWYSGPIAVSPGTTYYFEAWVMNACCPPPYGDGVNPVGPSELSFYANEELLGTRTSKLLGVWEPLGTVWSSGGATSVTLKLVNANTQASGNDFAVDDVFLGIESSINPPK